MPDYLNKANASLGDAAKTLESWAADLTTMRAKASQYETQAAQALQKLQQAQSNPNLKLAGEQFDTAQALQQAQSELNTAEQALNSAQQELNAIREDAQRLLAQHENWPSTRTWPSRSPTRSAKPRTRHPKNRACWTVSATR